MKRVAIVDLLLRWPPDGGAYVDLYENATRLARTCDVRLLVATIPTLTPRWPALRLGLDRTKFFLRGRLEPEPPFGVERLPFAASEYRPDAVVRAFRTSLERFRPDHVLVANGWQMKPLLLLGLREFAPILRLYSYEGLCLRAGTAFRGGAACDVDFLDGRPGSWLTCLACAAAFHAGYPSPAWLHELAASGALLPGYPDRVRAALAAASQVVVYSEAHGARVRPHARRVTVVPHGVRRAAFAVTPPPAAPPVRFLASGRFDHAEKGGATLLAACRQLARRRRDFELWVTTPRPPRDPFVRSVGWRRPEELPALYGQVHVVVVPSRWAEPFGIVAVEGMMAGRPVIASAVGGLPDIVTDDEAGLLVPPGDSAALACAMEALLDDPARRRRLGRAARTRAARCFDLDLVHERAVRPLFA
jgi:glycosyltransferase involved in cell wall biosynthesis